MAQIGTNEPTIQDLISLFGNTAIPALESLSRSDQSRQSHTINQNQALQSMAQDAAMHPIDMETKNVVNETGRARLPGWVADSAARTRTNQIDEGVGIDLPIKAGKAEYQGKIDKQHQSAIEQVAMDMMGSNDPKIRAHGKQLYMSLPAYIRDDLKEEAKQERELARLKQQHKNKMEELSTYGKWRPQDVNAASAAEAKAQLNPEYWFNKADATNDPLEKAYYQTKGENAHLRAQAIRQAGPAQGKAGGIDLGAQGVPVMPGGPRLPATNPVPANPRAALGAGAIPQGGPTVAPPKGPTTAVHEDWIKRMKDKHPKATRQEIIDTGLKLRKFD